MAYVTMYSPGVQVNVRDFSSYVNEISSSIIGIVGGARKGPTGPTYVDTKEEAIRLERERHAEEVHAAVEKAARKRKRTIAIAASIIIAAIAFVVLLTTVILPRRKSKALVTKYGQEFIDAFYALNVGDVYKFGS